MKNNVRAAMVVCVLLYCAFVQAPTFVLIHTYKESATILEMDDFGNLYYAFASKVFWVARNGVQQNVQGNPMLRKLGSIDVMNPMKKLLYYPDVQVAMLCDKQLNEISRVDFTALGYQSVSAVAMSNDNRLWFFDNTDFKLKKIDESGKVFRESQPLNVFISETPQPNFIRESNNEVFVNDSSLGILQFDIFGNYAKTIPLKGLARFQVFNQQIVFVKDGALQTYQLLTLETKRIALPDVEGVSLAAISKDRVAVFIPPQELRFYSY